MWQEATHMDDIAKKPFDALRYLATEGTGRQIVRLKAKQTFFSQGSHADSVFYLQTGRAKLTVVSKKGKEATVTLLAAGDFAGEESISTERATRMATGRALIACSVLRIDRKEMLRVLHEELVFSGFFLNFMLLRGMRTQADLID